MNLARISASPLFPPGITEKSHMMSMLTPGGSKHAVTAVGNNGTRWGVLSRMHIPAGGGREPQWHRHLSVIPDRNKQRIPMNQTIHWR